MRQDQRAVLAHPVTHNVRHPPATHLDMVLEDIALPAVSIDREREFDEPFVILDVERARDLLAAITREGKRWTRGGRFHHITGASDKATAFSRLVALYRRDLGPTRTIGLGDAPNDAGLLRVVDVPIAVASSRLAQLHALVPSAQVTKLPGPAGWNEAVLSLLDAHHPRSGR